MQTFLWKFVKLKFYKLVRKNSESQGSKTYLIMQFRFKPKETYTKYFIIMILTSYFWVSKVTKKSYQ